MTPAPGAHPSVDDGDAAVWSQSSPPEVSDGGFALAPWGQDDAGALFDIASDPDIQRLTSLPAFASVQQARAWICARMADASQGKALYLAIRAPEPVGSVHVIHFHEEHLSAELGYWLMPGARGRGLATRAIVALSGWCLTQFHWNRLELLVGPGNAASERVALRAGYVREGVLRRYRRYRGVSLDLTCFSLIQDDLSQIVERTTVG